MSRNIILIPGLENSLHYIGIIPISPYPRVGNVVCEEFLRPERPSRGGPCFDFARFGGGSLTPEATLSTLQATEFVWVWVAAPCVLRMAPQAMHEHDTKWLVSGP